MELPYFRTERLTRAFEPARRKAALLAVAVRKNNTLTLVAVSEAAQKRSVRAGMNLAEARAIVPELESVLLNEHEEVKALSAVAQFAYNFSPKISLLRPQTLVIDVTGCERLHGSEDLLAERVRVGIAKLGYMARVCVADHPAAGIAIARGSGRAIAVIASTEHPAALRNIPLTVLDLPAQVIAHLKALGVTQVGPLLNLPVAALPSRFGDELARVTRQLRGEEELRLETWMPEKIIRERVEFTGPTDRHEALLEGLKQAATFLSKRLEPMAAGALGLQANLIATEGAPVSFSLTLAAPKGDAKSLTTLLLNRFETVDTGEKWFEAVEVVLLGSETLPTLQRELFGAKAVETWRAEIAATVDELIGRLGAEAVVSARLTDHPDPQFGFRYARWSAAPGKAKPRRQSHTLPPRFDGKSCAVVPAVGELPAYWDFSQNAGGLRVVGASYRVDLGEPRDYLLVEDAQGARHFIWRANDGWHVPQALVGTENFAALDRCARPANAGETASYAELVCASNFSFLRGASSPHDLIEAAAARGLKSVALVDRHTLAGVVRAHEAGKERGVKVLIGTRIPLRDGPEICLYAMTRTGYGNICRLLTLGKLRTEKGDCELHLADLRAHAEGLQVVVLGAEGAPREKLDELRTLFPARLSLAVTRHFEFFDDERVRSVAALGNDLNVPLVAVNDVHWHSAENKDLQDLVTCVRNGTTLTEGVGLLFANAERRLKTPGEMAALFSDLPQTLARSVEIADSCNFTMEELKYEYPEELVPPGMTLQAFLVQETWKGAAVRFPEGTSETVRKKVERELALIGELGYAAYFLTIYEIVMYARSIGILCQGRGSAANSAVCYCLGITEVRPDRGSLLFERFISKERNEPPDIDVDFEHERREEVIQHIYEKYGRHRAGICSTVISYRYRSAIRDAGKALGLSLDQVGRLAKSSVWWDRREDIERAIKGQANVTAMERAVHFAFRLLSAPRHLSQHVGGFVITRSRLDELVPIENAAMEGRTFIEWNKDDIDALKILKVDVLALGMLTAIRKCFELVKAAGGQELTQRKIYDCDPTEQGETPEAQAIYTMLQRADAVGTFQVESRAQMSMLPRLKPAKLYDLVIEVAIVRPGPIEGGMMQAFIKRRTGEDKDLYVHPSLREVLKETLGVPLFQEQVMQIAVIGAGYSPGEADKLRRAIGSWNRQGVIEDHRGRIIGNMVKKGFEREYAERIFNQIAGFASYGFPESHAASFALITFLSAYLKRFYPAALTAALINSQPMGFYSASSLIRDAREHGVEIRHACVNASGYDCSLEGDGSYSMAPLEAAPEAWGKSGPAIRLGLRQITGMSEDVAHLLERLKREGGKFRDLDDVIRRLERDKLSAAQRRRSLVQLAAADAFACFGLSRRDALWHIAGVLQRSPQLFREQIPQSKAELPPMSAFEHMEQDYHMLSLSLRAHPMEFLRDELSARGVIANEKVRELPAGRKVEIAGLVINRQHPSTAKGVVFMTLEDETDIANIIVWPKIFERFRETAVGASVIAVKGKVERQGDVIHVVADSFRSLQDRFEKLKVVSRDFH